MLLKIKKNGDSIKIDQISDRVTPEVEKSNIYEDLEWLLNWYDTVNKSSNFDD